MCVSSSRQMMGHVVARSHLFLSRSNFADCIRCQGLRVSKTLRMESQQSKRPTCPACAKPTQLCLCNRMRSPCLDNQKLGVISNVSSTLMEDPSFDGILASPAAMDMLAKGFVVTKFSEGKQEFELDVPPGSALLFPSEESVMINDLKERGLKVRNLIVLDGTWSKARRMYLENPWLKLLCSHVKLEIEGASLYREVRRQPREGCLSTIESIVYAMKEMGEDPQGLDNMLDVFESMVGDQRRCKDENFVKVL
ncbi:hypothetical protein N665_1557s0005 [Sinapis alba]|nr:hypothetical protein N665_1557s0005 [Sinapis alba]